MQRSSRNNAVCFENLEKAISESPEAYRHINLLCAGWPCQGNSIAGKRAGMQHEGSGLWEEVARCLRLFNPQWFLGENVPGLLSVNGGKDFSKVISDLQKIGYGVSWRILDSQYFGVAQRRRRLFIVGYFGNICPPEILFDEKGGFGNDKAVQKMGERGLCISTGDGGKQDPTNETFVACRTGAITAKSYGDKGWAPTNEWNTILATTVRTQEPGNRMQGYVAQTLSSTPRGKTSFVWQDTHNAETNPKRKRAIAGTTSKLDSVRGIVIGNAVTVNVVEWIGKRIMKYERQKL